MEVKWKKDPEPAESGCEEVCCHTSYTCGDWQIQSQSSCTAMVNNHWWAIYHKGQRRFDLGRS